MKANRYRQRLENCVITTAVHSISKSVHYTEVTVQTNSKTKYTLRL